MFSPDEFVKQVIEARDESELRDHFMNLENKRSTHVCCSLKYGCNVFW